MRAKGAQNERLAILYSAVGDYFKRDIDRISYGIIHIGLGCRNFFGNLPAKIRTGEVMIFQFFCDGRSYLVHTETGNGLTNVVVEEFDAQDEPDIEPSDD